MLGLKDHGVCRILRSGTAGDALGHLPHTLSSGTRSESEGFALRPTIHTALLSTHHVQWHLDGGGGAGTASVVMERIIHPARRTFVCEHVLVPHLFVGLDLPSTR